MNILMMNKDKKNKDKMTLISLRMTRNYKWKMIFNLKTINNRDKMMMSNKDRMINRVRMNNSLVTLSKTEKVCYNGKINKKSMKKIYKNKNLLILNQKLKRLKKILRQPNNNQKNLKSQEKYLIKLTHLRLMIINNLIVKLIMVLFK